MTIFSGFRRLFEAIEELGRAVERLARAQEDVAPAIERLDALELSRHQFEAEVAGTLLEAKGKLRAASNAEARERQMKKSYEDLDPLAADLEAATEAGEGVHLLDVAPSETERLSALHLGVAPTDKSLAIAAKWGRQSA